jgi:hypothetical protein
VTHINSTYVKARTETVTNPFLYRRGHKKKNRTISATSSESTVNSFSLQGFRRLDENSILPHLRSSISLSVCLHDVTPVVGFVLPSVDDLLNLQHIDADEQLFSNCLAEWLYVYCHD